MKVHVPQGFTYAISSTDYRGFASLQTDVKATQSANYYFQGSSQNRKFTHTYTGLYRDAWQSLDRVPVDQLVYRTCGEQRNFNINTDLQVEPGEKADPTKVSFITMDSTDG